MAKYLVKTSFFVAEIEKDEELIQLAQVETIQKDTKIKVQPDGDWMMAKELPILMKVWGLQPAPSIPAIAAIKGADAIKTTMHGIAPVARHSAKKASPVVNFSGPDVPPPPPKNSPQPPRLETVVDFVPRFNIVQTDDTEDFTARQSNDVVLEASAAIKNGNVQTTLPTVAGSEPTQVTSDYGQLFENLGKPAEQGEKLPEIDTSWVEELVVGGEETVAMVKNPFFMDDSAAFVNNKQASISPSAEPSNAVALDNLEDDFEDEDISTSNLIKSVENLRQTNRIRIKKNAHIAKVDLEVEEAKTSMHDALNEVDEEDSTNDLDVRNIRNMALETARTKPIMLRDVEEAIEEDQTCERGALNAVKLEALVKEVIRKDEAEYNNNGAPNPKVRDPNIANAERLKAYAEAQAEAEAQLKADRLEAERLEAQQREAARLEEERLEAEQARLEAERAEQARLEAERAEQARLEAERAEQARLEAERAEQARLEAERAEQARLEAERAEQARLEAERAEQARLEAERAEQARLEAERAEQARLEAERAEQARLEEVGS